MNPQTYRIAIPEELKDNERGWELIMQFGSTSVIKKDDCFVKVPEHWLIPEEPPKKEWLEGEALDEAAHRIPMGTKCEVWVKDMGKWETAEFYRKCDLTGMIGAIHRVRLVFTDLVRIHLPSLSESQRKQILGDGE